MRVGCQRLPDLEHPPPSCHRSAKRRMHRQPPNRGAPAIFPGLAIGLVATIAFLQPACDAAMVRAGAAVALRKTVRAVPTNRRRAARNPAGMRRTMDYIAAAVSVIAGVFDPLSTDMVPGLGLLRRELDRDGDKAGHADQKSG